jgi:hypothetical protein
MRTLVFLIEQVAPGLYILVGAGIVWMLRRWYRARINLRRTHFELERDIFRYQRANAFTILILLLELGLAVLGIQAVVVPTLRSTASETSVDVVIDPPFYTPTAAQPQFGNSPIDASGVTLGSEQLVKVLATPTLTPTPVGTILPNAPAIEGCTTPNATLQVPANGMLVFEPVNVIGTAFVDNFAFYRFEIKGPQTFNSFATIRDYDRPVKEQGLLGQFVPAFYQPGAYQFRLTVFDVTNTLKAACTINMTITEPIPTATPLGSS